MFSGYILACIITKGFICTSLFYVQCRVSMQSIQFAKRPKKLGEFYQNRNNLINIRKIRIVLDDVTKYRESKPKSYLIWFVWSITTKLNNYKRKLSLSWLAKTMNWMRSLEKVNSKFTRYFITHYNHGRLMSHTFSPTYFSVSLFLDVSLG